MPLKIVRNDITKMNTEAIVNTANEQPIVGTGCDHAVYEAAGYDELLTYRKENIGTVKEGDVFITPGFRLPAQYIIHAVSPLFVDGKSGEEELLRSCYQKSLALAKEKGIQSIAFPLISTGGFGYPKEIGMRIAIDEIHAFLLTNDMLVYLVVFDDRATRMGKNLYPDLKAYIDRNYVREKSAEEYADITYGAEAGRTDLFNEARERERRLARNRRRQETLRESLREELEEKAPCAAPIAAAEPKESDIEKSVSIPKASIDAEDAAIEEMERKLAERMKHLSDSFSQYLLYLIGEKGMENSECYTKALVTKQVFSKIKNNQDYRPKKLTALCLCIGAKLNMDETRDLLSRAGYALSPCDKTDIIFSYFIENGIYDMIEVTVQLEAYGQPCIIG